MTSSVLSYGDYSMVNSSTKDCISYENIATYWKNSGYPDTDDQLANMLSDLGYSSQQIREAFETECSINESDDIEDLLKQLYQYIIDNNIKDEIIEQMKAEFGKQLEPVNRSFGIDKIKNIFKKLSEQDLSQVRRQQEQTAYGRNRKADVDPIDEGSAVHKILKSDQYVSLLNNLTSRLGRGIKITRIKNQILKSWRKGMHTRTHYDDMLKKISLSLKDLIK